MKAILSHKYGPPEVLEFGEAAKPQPKADEVLVRVHAASVNSWDWDNLIGTPIIRLLMGPLKPKYSIPGADIAGEVEAVGKDVRGFRPGDAVMGDLCASGWGAFAEYACAPERALVHKPAALTFEQAAAAPQAGVMALQAIRDYAKTDQGQRLLINGAGGGVGTYAIQLAKRAGAEVTAVDRTGKLDVLRSVGADHVIDFTQEDFTADGARYDVILDVVGKRSVRDHARALRDGGRYIMVGGPLRRILQFLVLGRWLSRTTGKEFVMLVHQPNLDLDHVAELLASGALRSVIDGPYALEGTPNALRALGAGQVRGKAVIRVSEASGPPQAAPLGA